MHNLYNHPICSWLMLFLFLFLPLVVYPFTFLYSVFLWIPPVSFRYHEISKKPRTQTSQLYIKLYMALFSVQIIYNATGEIQMNHSAFLY